MGGGTRREFWGMGILGWGILNQEGGIVESLRRDDSLGAIRILRPRVPDSRVPRTPLLSKNISALAFPLLDRGDAATRRGPSFAVVDSPRAK